MWNWLKRKRRPDAPTDHQTSLGEVQVPSGILLLADPMHLYDPVRIQTVRGGRFPVQAALIRYPEGGLHIAKGKADLPARNA